MKTIKTTGIAWLIEKMESMNIDLNSEKGQYIFNEYKRINLELEMEGIRHVKRNS
ncbi:MAG: hypothetical protein ACRDB0_04510 [Paraclostridium sp.]